MEGGEIALKNSMDGWTTMLEDLIVDFNVIDFDKMLRYTWDEQILTCKMTLRQ